MYLASALIAVLATSTSFANAACWRRPTPETTFSVMTGIDMGPALEMTVLTDRAYCDREEKLDVFVRNAETSEFGIMCVRTEAAQVKYCGVAKQCCTVSVKDPNGSGAPANSPDPNAAPPPVPNDAAPAPTNTTETPAPAPQVAQFVTPNGNFLELGSCGTPVAFNGTIPYVAMSAQDFGGDFNTASCNECVKIIGPTGKEVTAKIRSMCELGCEPGVIQLSAAAAAEIAPGVIYRAQVTWTKVACPAE